MEILPLGGFAPSLPTRSAESCDMPIRLIKHEAVPQCGSYEVDIRTADLPSTSIGMMFRAVA